jgi:uncharacterized protein (DUF849 family)
MADPVIIEVAINGATTKARQPHVPITREEMVADSLACLEAGAAMVHNHITLAKVSGEVAAEEYLGVWREVLAARPDALWYPTINFGPPEAWYDHIEPLAESGLLRVSLSDPGSVNLGTVRDGLPAGRYVYANSFDSIARHMELARRYQLGVSIAVYEPGFLRAVLAYHRAGQLPAGAFVKLYLCSDQGIGGSPFGLPPTKAALDAYLELLDGTGLAWAVSAVGADVSALPVAEDALAAGGHLHLGLEFYGGRRTPTNAELVREAVALCERVGRPVATCDQAAAVLGLGRAAPV